jgi:hypothetical protein
MAYDTVVTQGTFVGTGSTVIIPVRSDIDWMSVYNYTQIATPADVGFQYYWQRGMPIGGGLIWTNPAAPTFGALANPAGFTLINTSIPFQVVSPAVITDISNANPPVVTSAGHGLVTGDIVLISSAVGASQLGGIPFLVTVIDANNFSLVNMIPIVAAAAPGATSRVRKIGNATYWNPYVCIITNMTAAVNAVVTFSAPHTFQTGSQIRFQFPFLTDGSYGNYTSLNGNTANIIATTASTITLDINTVGLGAFTFPVSADGAFGYTPAQVIPVGENTATALSLVPPTSTLGDAQVNVAILGMKLGGGANTPGGANADLMYWQAGKAFSNNGM